MKTVEPFCPTCGGMIWWRLPLADTWHCLNCVEAPATAAFRTVRQGHKPEQPKQVWRDDNSLATNEKDSSITAKPDVCCGYCRHFRLLVYRSISGMGLCFLDAKTQEKRQKPLYPKVERQCEYYRPMPAGMNSPLAESEEVVATKIDRPPPVFLSPEKIAYRRSKLVRESEKKS